MGIRRLLLTAAAATFSLTGCAAAGAGDGGDAHPATPAVEATPAMAATPAHHEAHEAELALCTVLPSRVVGDLVGTAAALDVSGAGSQCTWSEQTGSERSSGRDEPGAEVASAGAVLQGAVVDLAAFDAGRPPVGGTSPYSVADVGGVGDEAFVVRADGAPTTLYVRDGARALSLWLDADDVAPAAAERSLTRTATLLLRLA